MIKAKIGSVDYQKFNEFEDLVSADGDDFISSLVTRYLSLAADRLDSLRELSRRRDYEGLRREVHSFKLSCQILGAFVLSDCLERVSIAAVKGDIELLTVAICDTETESENVIRELSMYLERRAKRKEMAG